MMIDRDDNINIYDRFNDKICREYLTKSIIDRFDYHRILIVSFMIIIYLS